MKVKTKKKAAKKKAMKKAAAVTKPAGKGYAVGRTSGLSVSAFWSKLLADNGKAKQTDKQLAKTFAKEFPAREIVQPVGRVRSMYNRGILGYGNPPGKAVKGTPKQSYAYDADGNVTTSAAWDTGRKPNPNCVKAGAARAKKRWAKAKKKTIKVKRAGKRPAKPSTKPAKAAKPAKTPDKAAAA